MSDILRSGEPTTYTAGAAVEKGDCLQYNGDQNVIKTAADTDIVVGIALQDAASGEQVLVGTSRRTYTLRASAGITAEDKVCPAADGEIKTAASGDEAFGMAWETVSSANDPIKVLCFTGTQRLA